MTTQKVGRQRAVTILTALFLLMILPILVTASQSVAGHDAERKIILIGGYDACNNFIVPTCPQVGIPPVIVPDRQAPHNRNTEHPSWAPIIEFLTEDDAGGSVENTLVRRLDLKDEDFFILSYSGDYDPPGDFRNPTYTAIDTCLSDNKSRRFGLYCQVQQSGIDQVVQNITEIINSYANAEFDIISFSEGGVVATYWAGSLDKDNPLLKRVNSVTTIDSPIAGDVFLPYMGRKVSFMSDEVKQVIVKAPRHVPLYTIRNTLDQIVPWDQATLEGAWNDSGRKIVDPLNDVPRLHNVRPNRGVQERIASTLISGKVREPTGGRPQIVSRWPIIGLRSFQSRIFKPTFIPENGLQQSDFGVEIGDQGAQIQKVIRGGHLGRGLLWPESLIGLKLGPPDLADGTYDLFVDPLNTHLDVDIQDTEAQSVVYGEANVDVVLAIDRSGSMSGGKIADAKRAAKAFVDFMSEGDMIGVVSFGSTAEVRFPLTTIASTREDAKAAIDGISTSGSTTIGGGLEKGLDEINSRGGSTAFPRDSALK